VQSNPARVANIVDFSQLTTDLANNTVADYVWISPDQCHDMHGRGATPADPCDFSQVQALIATGDTFLLSTVNGIRSSKAWTGNSVIFITWDESDFTGTGPSGFGDTSGCNHYSMLATIEDSWHLGCLVNTCDRDSVQPMRELVGPVGGW
jgi:hypothetical protein